MAHEFTTDREPDVLRRAAVIIEKRGWYDGRPSPGSGFLGGPKACVVTAIYNATADMDAARATCNAFRSAIGFTGPLDAWNDVQPSGESVTAKMREVADQIEAAA